MLYTHQLDSPHSKMNHRVCNRLLQYIEKHFNEQRFSSKLTKYDDLYAT